MQSPLNLLRFKVKKNSIIIGVILVISSFLIWLIDSKEYSLTLLALFFTLFCQGAILIFDTLDYKISGSSLLINKKHIRFLNSFGLAGALAGIILDLTVHVITKNYIYPYFTTTTYLVLFIPGFIFYFLTIAESYFGIKSLLDLVLKRPKVRKIDLKRKNYLFNSLFLVGLIGLTIAIAHYISLYIQQGNFTYSTNQPIELKANIFITMLLAISLWLIIETLGHYIGRKMLLDYLFAGYLRPFFVVIIACILVGIPMEIWNIPLKLWIYTNIPFDNIQLFGVPIFVLISWPFHYLPFLSLYVALNKKVEERPYIMDNIKTT